MKITILLENTTCSTELNCAHGLSLYIEVFGKKILFDTGCDNQYLANAQKLNIDLSTVDFAIISHGHHDHTGGLCAFLELNKHAPVYIHEGAFAPFYHIRESGPHYVGIDPEVLKYRNRFIITYGSTLIENGLLLFDDVPNYNNSINASVGLTEKISDTQYKPEDFHHEQNLLISENGKILLIAGCAHRGISNIITKAEILMNNNVDITLGGFHLFQLTENSESANSIITETGTSLLSHTTQYYTGHCTGEYAYTELKKLLNEKLHKISTGMVYEW